MEPTVTHRPGEPPEHVGAREHDTTPHPSTVGPYRVTGELGRGGMGVVLLARDDRLQRDVAIKLLPARLEGDPSARERFLAEARALAALNHPNIAIIPSLEESNGRHF